LRAQDLQPAPPGASIPSAPPGASLLPAQSPPPAAATTPPAAPATAGAQAEQGQQPSSAPLSGTPVSPRAFAMHLIVLPADHLLGDWWGLRTRLEDRGITPTLTFVSDLAGNPVGGARRGFTEADNLGLNVNFDLDKMCGLKGGAFFVSMSQRSGANLSAI